MIPPADELRAWLSSRAAWLLAPELITCVVGSSALAEACRRAGVAGPTPKDLDLAWTLDPTSGAALLRQHGVLQPTSEASWSRGTLALAIDSCRIEITTFRGERTTTADKQIVNDLQARDMTVGALAWWLGQDRILDPTGGFDDWNAGRIVAVGEPRARIEDHPVRWLRYYRRAQQWQFTLDPRVRALRPDSKLLAQIPAEALAAELRAALLECRSPGRLLLELHDARLLPLLTPELAPQFDGRPAGPVRYHPEVSQALHVILSLEWLNTHAADLAPADRVSLATAVLCHDLGKNLTPPDELPSHRGHEANGHVLLDTLLDRLPGLVDAAGRRLAHAVAELHLVIRRFSNLRPGTLAGLFERWFRPNDFRLDLFALAVGADVGGRLGREAQGIEVARQVEGDVTWLRQACQSVDAAALAAAHADDLQGFKRALHEARAAALQHRPA